MIWPMRLVLNSCKDEDERKLLALYRRAKADGSIQDERSKEALFNRCDAFRVYSPLVELLRKKEFSESILDRIFR